MSHAFLNIRRRPEVFQACTKRAYETSKDARRAMNRGVTHRGKGMVAMGTGIMNVYRCGICGAFHLGHK